ncbi:MAG: MFS transporter, partial [Candidatus Ancillula sp.]|nr:MFS transporter [Candidatus Ancillula sp.]
MVKLYKYLRHTPKGSLVLAIVFIGVICRAPAQVYAPIVSLLQNEFAVNYATIGLLSGVPVFCYAAFTPLASWVIGKKGLEYSTMTGVIIIGSGICLRMFGGYAVVLLATIIIGAGIAFTNTVVPLICARDFSNHYAAVTGIYSAMMNFGAILASAITMPITLVLGWRLAIFGWVFVDILVIVFFLAYIYRKKRGASRKLIARNKDHKSDEWTRLIEIDKEDLTG